LTQEVGSEASDPLPEKIGKIFILGVGENRWVFLLREKFEMLENKKSGF